MDINIMKAKCSVYLNKKKGYIAELFDYKEDDISISFEIHILKNGAFRGRRHINISKTSELGIDSQLESKVSLFAALVENGRY